MRCEEEVERVLDDGQVLERAFRCVGPLHAGGLEGDVEGEAGIIDEDVGVDAESVENGGVFGRRRHIGL